MKQTADNTMLVKHKQMLVAAGSLKFLAEGLTPGSQLLARMT